MTGRLSAEHEAEIRRQRRTHSRIRMSDVDALLDEIDALRAGAPRGDDWHRGYRSGISRAVDEMIELRDAVRLAQPESADE